MPLGTRFEITPQELQEIFSRLKPYLPSYLKKVEPQRCGIRFEFTPFTGREDEPLAPLVSRDPKLAYVLESENEAEHLLREKARVVLSSVYDTAREEWRDAAYVADLKRVAADASDRWKAYERAMKALESAYGYLRTPEAAKEWQSAVSRLIDTQDHAKAAALAFDERAREIAEVHDTYLYSELDRTAALTVAGYPEGANWHIRDLSSYGRNHYSEWDTNPPLGEQVRRLVEQQDAHLVRVGRLSGASAG